MKKVLMFMMCMLVAVGIAFAEAPLTTGAKGSTPASFPTSTAIDANTQAMDVAIRGNGNPCQSPTAILQMASGTTSGNSATQIVALSGTTSIHVCSLNVVSVSGTTPTFGLVYGTGSNCGTGQGTALPAFATAATAGTLYTFATPVTKTPAGQALCYLDGGTTPVQTFSITYVQQ